MLGRYLQLAADMVHTQFPKEFSAFISQKIIKPDSGTDKYFFYTGQRPEFFQKSHIIRVIRIQIRTWFREKALPVLTYSPGQLLFTGRMTEVGGRSADIMDITFEIS